MRPSRSVSIASACMTSPSSSTVKKKAITACAGDGLLKGLIWVLAKSPALLRNVDTDAAMDGAHALRRKIKGGEGLHQSEIGDHTYCRIVNSGAAISLGRPSFEHPATPPR